MNDEACRYWRDGQHLFELREGRNFVSYKRCACGRIVEAHAPVGQWVDYQAVPTSIDDDEKSVPAPTEKPRR